MSFYKLNLSFLKTITLTFLFLLILINIYLIKFNWYLHLLILSNKFIC